MPPQGSGVNLWRGHFLACGPGLGPLQASIARTEGSVSRAALSGIPRAPYNPALRRAPLRGVPPPAPNARNRRSGP